MLSNSLMSECRATKCLLACAAISTVTLLGSTVRAADPASAPAANAAPPALSIDYSGDLWNRSTVTGDCGGTRNDQAKKGLTLDMYSTQVFQGVVAGGRDKSWQYGGRENITLNIDTGKMGLWPGGFLMVEGEGNYGEFVGLPQTGMILPSDSNAIFPNANGPQFALGAFQYMQFLSPNIGVFFGKLDTTGGDANNFAHGKGDRQFMNMAFGLNPALAVTCPPYTVGAGLVVLPTGNPEEAIITGSVMDTEGRPDTFSCDSLFQGGTSFALEGRMATHFFNLTGHQLLGGTYSDRLYTDVNQRLLNFIIPGLPIQNASGSWALYYNFDQYLYQPDPKVDRGLGIFGRFGVTDGEANPVHYFASVGLGGKGLIPGRPNDQFGIGFYRICRSSSPALDTLGFRDSQGFEAYYEVAITPAILLTPDIQVLEPSQKGVHTDTILGLRLTVKF